MKKPKSKKDELWQATKKKCPDVENLLATLTPREEQVIRMRFGVGGERHTLEQVGERFAITSNRVRQIEAKAWKKILERSAIVKVISNYINLKKIGRNYLGLCPFHVEKTPSFTVNEEKGIFHCFGCGVGGSLFNFKVLIRCVTRRQ